jgi:hypothetical protein
LRLIALAIVVAFGLMGAACSIFGEYEATTIRTEKGKTEIDSRQGGGALRCGLDQSGEFPCRAVIPSEGQP